MAICEPLGHCSGTREFYGPQPGCPLSAHCIAHWAPAMSKPLGACPHSRRGAETAYEYAH